MAREAVGKVLDLTARGLLVKGSRMVPLGTTLVDVRDQQVGRVADVLGPVAGPYLLVSTPKGAKGQRPGREVYLP